MKKHALPLRVAVWLLCLALCLPVCLTGCRGNQSAGNTTDTQQTGGDDTPAVDVTAPPPSENAIPYRVLVRTEGGLALSGVTVTLTDPQGIRMIKDKTDADGVVTARLDPGEYTVGLSDLKPGFYAPTEPVKTNTAGDELVVTVFTQVITTPEPSDHTEYQVGDILYDFTFTTTDGTETSLSEVLKTKKLVVLNFWATWCGPCKAEFPAIQTAYEEHSDAVEIIAMSISDTNAACDTFRRENGLTFHMMQDFGLWQKFRAFGNGGIPFTIFVDRYGMFVNYVAGSDPSVDAWRTEFAGYTADSYVPHPGAPISSQPATDTPVDEPDRPDVSMPASADIEAVVNGNGFTASYTGPEADTVWPWVLSEDQGSIVPANIGHHSTMAMITTEVDFVPGQVLAFDYKASIERDVNTVYDYDLLSVYVDGHQAAKLYGAHPDWETCYVYTATSAGKHEVTLLYVKDDSDIYLPGNQEYVNVRNLRFVSVADMTAAGGSLLTYHPGAWEPNTAQNPKTSYLNYIDVVLNRADGYYHVGTADGPLLLCSLLYGTAWSSTSINTLSVGGYLVFDLVDYSERINSYAWIESHSSLGYCPVDATLADMLDLIVSKLGEGPDHDQEWLELCCYFDHYGTGHGVTNVFDVCQGISVNSAFTATLGKNHVVFDQVLVPRGLYYEFIPETSGVYTFYSLDYGPDQEDRLDTYGWLVLPDGTLRGRYVDESDSFGDDENFHLTYRCEAGEAYYVVVAFNEPSTLGEFDFVVEYLGQTYAELIDCTRQYITDENGTSVFVDRMYGLHAVLCDDGYYHKVLSYEADGTPVPDMSENGYIYVNFTGLSVFMSFILYNGDFMTLAEYIRRIGFDFTNQTDGEGNSLAVLGNYQAEMEAYLEMAEQATGAEHGYVRADRALVDILEHTLIPLYGLDHNGRQVADQWLMFCSFYRTL